MKVNVGILSGKNNGNHRNETRCKFVFNITEKWTEIWLGVRAASDTHEKEIASKKAAGFIFVRCKCRTILALGDSFIKR